MFFKKKEIVEDIKIDPPRRPVAWPHGIFVSTETDTWMIVNDVKMRVFSPRVLESWKVRPAAGTDQSLSKFKRGSRPLGFRDGTLIKDISDGKMYLVSKSKKRHIVNPDTLPLLGLKLEDAMLVSSAETAIHEDGEDLNG